MLIAPAYMIGQIVVIGRRELFASVAFKFEVKKHHLKVCTFLFFCWL